MERTPVLRNADPNISPRLKRKRSPRRRYSKQLFEDDDSIDCIFEKENPPQQQPSSSSESPIKKTKSIFQDQQEVKHCRLVAAVIMLKNNEFKIEKTKHLKNNGDIDRAAARSGFTRDDLNNVRRSLPQPTIDILLRRRQDILSRKIKDQDLQNVPLDREPTPKEEVPLTNVIYKKFTDCDTIKLQVFDFVKDTDSKCVGANRLSIRNMCAAVKNHLYATVSVDTVSSIRKGSFIDPRTSYPNRLYPKAAEDQLVSLVEELRKSGLAVYPRDMIAHAAYMIQGTPAAAL